jgi:ADP-ribosylglycohydrolase
MLFASIEGYPTAAVTGALAGLFWHIDTMPDEWRLNIARHDDIMNLCTNLKIKLGKKVNH